MHVTKFPVSVEYYCLTLFIRMVRVDFHELEHVILCKCL